MTLYLIQNYSNISGTDWLTLTSNSKLVLLIQKLNHNLDNN